MSRNRTSPRSHWTPAAHHQYTRNTIATAPPKIRRTLYAFATWLGRERDLGAGTITVRIQSARWLLTKIARSSPSRSVPLAMKAMTADRIERLFVEYGRDHGLAARRSMSAAMRLWLRFACARGWISDDLIAAVPSLHGYRLSTVPRAIPEVETKQLLESLAASGTKLRNRALVLLVATYGIRRGQVSALRLCDVDWRERTIRFDACKGGKAVHHVMSPTVADALARYLRHDRPRATSEYVFLRSRPPYIRLGPSAITGVVWTCMLRAGLPARGPHALRHAFATRLLAGGQSFKTIADLLGHRSLSSVAIYAKVDRVRLLEVAPEWPEVVS